MKNKKTPTQLMMLLVIFIAPMLLSFLLFHYHDYFNLKKTNHGTLVNPPLRADFLYRDNNPQAKNIWRIVYIPNEICNAQCNQVDYLLHQVQKALGNNRERVSILILKNKTAQFKKLETLFASRAANFNSKNKIYLIDPAGNLFMYYPDNTDLVNVLKDMKRVLEVSQIG